MDFCSNIPLYSCRFQFRIIILVNFNFNFRFSRFSISEISISFTWCFLCESWSKFHDFLFHGFFFQVFIQKISISLISHHISSFNLIWVQKISENNIISLWFDSYSQLYLLIRVNLIKLVSLVLILTWFLKNSTSTQNRFVNHPSTRCLWCLMSMNHIHNRDMNQLDWQ